MENNLINKAKFFSQYFGQIVLIEPDFIPFGEKLISTQLSGVDLDTLSESDYLHLKPLSSITDEDALEVSKILGLIEPYIDSTNSDYMIVKELAFKSLQISYTGYICVRKGSVLYNVITLIAYDYLRSKGYALPFHDLSVEQLVEYGWVKLNA